MNPFDLLLGAGVGGLVGFGWPGLGARVGRGDGVGLGANPVTTPKGCPVTICGATVSPGRGETCGWGVGFPLTPGIHWGSWQHCGSLGSGTMVHVGGTFLYSRHL